MVEDTPLGPEVLIGIPIYSGSEMLGLLVAHFDMRSLLTYTSGAEDLVVLAPQGVLWPGRFAVDATPLTGQEVAKILPAARLRLSTTGVDNDFDVIMANGQKLIQADGSPFTIRVVSFAK